MSYVFGSGQVILGIALLVLWWLALQLMCINTPLSMRFALWPCLFLLWIVGAMILILHGATVI